MGRRPTLLLLLLLLGAAGAYDPQHCPLAVEFSCQDGQPAYSVCREGTCTTTALYYDGSQDLSSHDASKCREHSCTSHDDDCCGYDHETWCADGYTLVRGSDGGGCWPGNKGYRCLPPDATPAPTSSATPVPTQHTVFIDGTTPPEIVRAYDATAYDVCDAWGECPLTRAVCESDPELRDNCECASYDPWRPDCRYASCGQCNCDWWHDPLTDDCCSAHCWQECWEEAWPGKDGLPGPGNATRNATDRATGTTCFNGSPLAMGETVLRCPAGQYAPHEGSCVCVADQTPPEPPRCLLRDHADDWECETWDGEEHCWHETMWHGWDVDGAAQTCDALRCDPATGTIFFAGYSKWDHHYRGEGRRNSDKSFWKEEPLACLVARTDGVYARQSITQEQGKWEAWMWKERGHWGRWQDVASPLGNASYYGRVVRACADECGGCAAIAASAEELRLLANLERAYGMSGGGPAVAPLGNEADAACFGKTFRAGHYHYDDQWFWISTGHALVIALLAVLCVVPPLTACCSSHDWCPWYGPLQRARNNFAELCPALAKCLDFCCVGVCNRCDDWRKRCCKFCCRCCRREKPCPVVAASGAVELAPLHLEVVAAGPPGTAMAVPLPGGGAVQVAVPEGLAAGATFAVAVPVTEQPVAAAPPPPRQLDDTLEVVARPRSVLRQVRLVLWKQLRVKYRSPFAILAQLLFPALWFVFIWMLYIFMARTFLSYNLRWNKDHYNFACKRSAARTNTTSTRAKGRMGSRERGDYISHGYLENYLAPIAFVPFLQVVVVGVVVEHRDKLVEAMRMAGLKPVSYWSATFIFEALITGFWSAFLVACVAVGGLFNAAGHHDDPFGILLALHYVYIIVLVSQSFAATMLPVLRSPTTAALYALIAQVGCLACYNVMVVRKEVTYKRTKKKVTRKVYPLFEASVESQRAASVVPQLGYSLLVDSFRSHRVHKCEVSAGYQGEVWRSQLMKCGWRVDRTWSSVAAWKNLTVPGDPLTPWCPGFGEDDGDDDDDERRRRLDEEDDGAEQVCERRRRLVDADDDDDLDDNDREVCPNPTCPDGSAATCCDTADGDCDDGDDDWCCGTDFLCTNDSPDWAAHQGGVLCCSLGHAPTTPKTWPGTTGWCRSELDFEIGNYNGTECWAACEAMFGAELVAVDWDATDCYCQDACLCMDDHLDPGVGLATRASLATLPDQCAYDFCKVEVRSEYPPFYGVTDTGQGPRPRDAWTGGIYGMLLLDVVLYALVAWYLSQVFSAEGASKKWYFPFLPSTYGFGREEARGADVSEEDANPMLAAEEDEDDADAEAKFDPRPPGFRASIDVRRLSKTFGTHRAVDGVSLQLADSEIFCLLGHNGAGKTTTIGVLTGLLDPDYTTRGIAAFGRDVLAEGGMDFLRATLGVCPQHDVLFPRLTCREHVKFFSMLKGKSAERAARDADALLDVFHLKDRGRHLGSELSGGQKRKLSVSIALSGSSKFIVLDEPTAGMDPVARREFWSLLRGVRENRCLLLTTHHMEEAEALGDRVAIMAAGSVRCEGSVAFLTRRFGAGYTLKVDPMNDAAANALAKAGSSATASGGHQIPIKSAVAPLLAELDAAGVSYEASGTTLEDVFLAVGEDEVAHNVGAVKDWSQGSVRAGEMVSAAPKLSEERPGFEGHFRAVFTKRLKLVMNDLRLFLVPVRWVLAILRDFEVEGAARLLEKLGPHGGGARGVVLLLLPGLCSVIICALYRDKKLVSKSRHHADDLANFYVAVCLAGSSIFVAGIVAEPLVRERARRLRNLLSVSGLDARAYWLGTAAADYAILFVGVVVTLIALKSGSVARKADSRPKHFHKDYTKRELWVEDEWVVFVLILAPLAVVAFGHAGSHAFSEPVMTLAGFPVISIALLVAPLVVALMVWMLFGGVLIPRKRAPALKQINLNFFELQATYAWLCTLASPAGALLMAMLNAAKIRLLPVRGSGFGKAFLGDPDRRIETVPGGGAQTSAPGAMDVVWPPMWASLFVLLLHVLVFGAIAYAVDRMATRPLPFKKAKLSRRRRANLDPDVMAERRRTLALLVGHAAEAAGDGTEVEVVETEAALPPKPTPPWRRVAQRVADRLAAKVRAVRAAMTNRLSQNEDRAPDLKSAWPGLGAFELRKIYPPQRFGAKAVEAVQNLTFSVAPGEVFGLLGANGAGKSTSISMIVRAVEPHSGHATVSGKSVLDDFAGASRGLGVVNQHNTLWDDLSCLDHLLFFAALRTKVGHERIALTTLAQLELSHHAHKMAGRLSGGMKRKLCCAVALVGDPHVVLLDEPSAGLDPVSQRNLWNLIKSTMTGRAVLLTTHSMLEADALCDRIGIQVRGQFHCVGSPQHLKDRYASGYELVAYLETEDHEPALGAYLRSKLEAAGCGCALAGLAAGVATYELQGERPLKHAFACLEDADARARLGVRSFRVDRASMEKVFIRIVGEGGDEDLDTDATNAMGRSVAQALQDDQEEDLELARDLAAVGFDEPRDCCGILTRFGHASLARYSCAMCCGTYVYWCMGLFIQGIIPWLFCCWFCELWCVCGVWHWICCCFTKNPDGKKTSWASLCSQLCCVITPFLIMVIVVMLI